MHGINSEKWQRTGREKKEIEEEKHTEIGEELKQQSSEVAEEDRTIKMQQEQQVEKGILKKEEVKFLNMFKKIEIDIPFSEALTQMPHYAKFMKDILS